MGLGYYLVDIAFAWEGFMGETHKVGSEEKVGKDPGILKAKILV